jgi:hypothetical protein
MTRVPMSGVEPYGPFPDVGKCLLHDILGCLRIPSNLLEKGAQPRRIFPVKRIESRDTSTRYLLPNIAALNHYASLGNPEAIQKCPKSPVLGKLPPVGFPWEI